MQYVVPEFLLFWYPPCHLFCNPKLSNGIWCIMKLFKSNRWWHMHHGTYGWFLWNDQLTAFVFLSQFWIRMRQSSHWRASACNMLSIVLGQRLCLKTLVTRHSLFISAQSRSCYLAFYCALVLLLLGSEDHLAVQLSGNQITKAIHASNCNMALEAE